MTDQAARQHFLCFLPEPQMQGSLRPIFGPLRTCVKTGAKWWPWLQFGPWT